MVSREFLPLTYMMMDDVMTIPPIVQKHSQNILDMSTAILEPKSVQQQSQDDVDFFANTPAQL